MRWTLAVRAAGLMALAHCRLALLSLVLGALGGTSVMAAGPPRAMPPVITLEDGTAPIENAVPGLQWFDAKGTATLAQVLSGQGHFSPLRLDQIHGMGSAGALWVHLRLMRAPLSRKEWRIELPVPLLDSVTLYQRDRDGGWRSQAAGDQLPVTSWPTAGRYPSFDLDLPPAITQDIYLQIRHGAKGNFPLRISTEADNTQRMQLGYLALGMAFGGLFLLIATCLAQSWAHRDRTYAWYAAYAAVVTLAVAAYTGAAAHLIWPYSDTWADMAPGTLGALAAGSGLLFVRDLSGIAARHAWLVWMVRWVGWAGPFLAAIYWLLERSVGVALMGVYLPLASLLSVLVAWLSWRRGDHVGLWVLAAFAPLFVALLLVAGRLFGLSTVSWGTRYAIVAALALQVPLLLVALNIRSRERHGAEIREQALSTQDALTGLLSPHLFHDRLRQVVSRHKRHGEDSAVVFISLVNHAHIKSHFGSAVAEQSLLRCVIKLRRLVRDVDTLSRIGEARFGLIMEGVNSRAVVTDRAARLIAAGLMPLPGLKPDVTLQFHIAAALLDEHQADAADLADDLEELISGMSTRTRRPIRFLEPESTQPAPLTPDSALLDPEGVPSEAASGPSPLK